MNKDILDDLKTLDFLRAVSMRNLKSRATNIEMRIRKKNGWSKVQKRNNEFGDAKSNQFGFIEIKSSLVSPLEKSKVTFRGIKNWEVVDKFLFVIIDLKNYDLSYSPEYYLYLMDKKDIEEESLKIYNQRIEVAEKNSLIARGLDFTTDREDEVFKRWNLEYCAKEYIYF